MKFIQNLMAVLAMTIGAQAIPRATVQSPEGQGPVPDGWHRSGEHSAGDWFKHAWEALIDHGDKYCDLGGGKMPIVKANNVTILDECYEDFKAYRQFTNDGYESDWICRRDPTIRFSMNRYGWDDPWACHVGCRQCTNLALLHKYKEVKCQRFILAANCRLTWSVISYLGEPNKTVGAA